jgi:hypothetical protein
LYAWRISFLLWSLAEDCEISSMLLLAISWAIFIIPYSSEA